MELFLLQIVSLSTYFCQSITIKALILKISRLKLPIEVLKGFGKLTYTGQNLVLHRIESALNLELN